MFYSDSCKYSRDVLTSLNERHLADKFDLVDVVTNPVPAGVTSVPTVYEKVTCSLRKGAEVFQLVEELSKDELTCYEFGQDTMGYSDLDFTKSSTTSSYSWI